MVAVHRLMPSPESPRRTHFAAGRLDEVAAEVGRSRSEVQSWMTAPSGTRRTSNCLTR